MAILEMSDASLYNGQPSDTGSSCPCIGLTSSTPPTSKDKGGVSVENVPAALNGEIKKDIKARFGKEVFE